MPLLDIRKLLSASRELKALHTKTQRLVALQRAYLDIAPLELSRASRVGYFRAGTLYLIADNAAIAAKLRNVLPRLLPIFRKLEGEVTGIRVEVQVNRQYSWRTTPFKKASLTIENIQQFENLSKQVTDPALKSALANFARRRKAGTQ